MQPVRVPDPWHRVLYLGNIPKLQSSLTNALYHPSHHHGPATLYSCTCCRAAGIVMIFWMVLPSLSM